jgi:two-component system phosphate regulon response regulator PhoB
MAGKILVVEDERDIADLITFNLEREGFGVVSARSGEEGIERARTDRPDLILLDIMLPGINGIDVCRMLKTEDSTQAIPIIMLTARHEDIDVITGLEVGADDYVTKPFSPRILVARIRAILRRHKTADKDESPIHLGELTIDPRRHTVTAGRKRIDLTFTEFQIILTLARRPGWVFSRSQLIDELRDGQHVVTDRAIDVQVANLRRKLGKYRQYVETVRGIGYRMREMP